MNGKYCCSENFKARSSALDALRNNLGELLRNKSRDFPGGSVSRLCTSIAKDMGLILGQGTKIPNAVQHGQKKKKKKE